MGASREVQSLGAQIARSTAEPTGIILVNMTLMEILPVGFNRLRCRAHPHKRIYSADSMLVPIEGYPGRLAYDLFWIPHRTRGHGVSRRPSSRHLRGRRLREDS